MDLPKLNLPSYPFDIKRQKGTLYIDCVIRKRRMKLTPEEWVRQNFIVYLIHELGVSKNLIAVEKQIEVNGLKKRFDILIYKDALPSVLIECKSVNVKLTDEVFKQVANYNLKLKVPYLCITNGLSHYWAIVDQENGSARVLSEFPDL